MIQTDFKRVETKYRLDEEQYKRLRELMCGRMVADAWGESSIRNVYFDTPDMCMIRRSLAKPLYKEKLRVRSYGKVDENSTVFLELKKKFDGVVYKRRAQLAIEDAYALVDGTREGTSQIERELSFCHERYGTLVPAFFVAYEREAFYGADDDTFRMTFDRNVRYRTDDMRLDGSDVGTCLLGRDEVLLEVKSRGAMPLWLVRFLSAERLFKTSFSKVGAAYVREMGHRETSEVGSLVFDVASDVRGLLAA